MITHITPTRSGLRLRRLRPWPHADYLLCLVVRPVGKGPLSVRCRLRPHGGLLWPLPEAGEQSGRLSKRSAPELVHDLRWGQTRWRRSQGAEGAGEGARTPCWFRIPASGPHTVLRRPSGQVSRPRAPWRPLLCCSRRSVMWQTGGMGLAEAAYCGKYTSCACPRRGRWCRRRRLRGRRGSRRSAARSGP